MLVLNLFGPWSGASGVYVFVCLCTGPMTQDLIILQQYASLSRGRSVLTVYVQGNITKTWSSMATPKCHTPPCHSLPSLAWTVRTFASIYPLDTWKRTTTSSFRGAVR